MNENMDIKHEDIKIYILDECNDEQLNKIKKLQNDNPTLAHLISIIDEFKQKLKSDLKNISKDIPESFSEIDSIILKILSGSIDESFAQNFLNWIIQSPSFFEKFYIKLDLVSLVQLKTDLPEIQEVAIKTDDDILEQAGILKEQPKEEKRSIFELIKELIDNIIAWFQVKPKLAYSFSTAVITFLIIVFTIIPPGKKDPFESYIYTDRVPYEYDISSFRGQTDDSRLDPILESFKNDFKMGISDYMLCDYKSAIKTWEELKPITTEFENKPSNQDYLPWIRELYFYLGVSHLALGRIQELNQEETKKYLSISIEYLLKSESLVSKYSLKNGDKENYFLGLVYGFNGDVEITIEYFKKIDSSFRNYEKSKNLLDILSNK